MKASIKGNTLTITMDLQEPTPSKSGKSRVVASTRGITNAGVKVDGHDLRIGVNAFIPMA
jgi:hypothetical protein